MEQDDIEPTQKDLETELEMKTSDGQRGHLGGAWAKVEEMGGDQVGGRDPIPPTKRAYSQNIIINVHYIYLFWSSKACRIGAWMATSL